MATIAAATAILDYDLLQAKRTAQAPNDRALTKIGLAGSAAVLDTAIDLFLDTVFVGRYWNRRANAPPNNDDMIAVGNLGWPRGARIAAVVADAPATNPINFQYDWIDL
jgi:hypothetical protein